MKLKFFDLDSTLEPRPTLEPKVDFPELLMVPKPITFELKSTIPPSHILLLDIGRDHNDSVMIFQDWSCKGNKFMIGSFMILFILVIVNRKEVNKGGFCEPPYYLDWVATLVKNT